MKRSLSLWILALFIAINIYAFFFVYAKAKDCACSQNKKLDFIKTYVFISLIVDIVLLYICISKFKLYKRIYKKAIFVILPFSLLYTYITYLYVEELVREKCKCIEPLYMHLLYYVSLASSVIFSSFGLLLIGSFILLKWQRG